MPLGILFIISTLAGTENGYGQSPVRANAMNLDPYDKNALTQLGKGVVGKALLADPIADTSLLVPLRSGAWTYSLLSGDPNNTHQEDVMEISRHRSRGVLWRKEIGKRSIEFLSAGEGGDIKMVSEVVPFLMDSSMATWVI